MIEDRLLILRCKRGSTDALRRIYQKYKDNLLVLAAAILNDTAYAEDVLHDVFISFVRALDGFRLSGSLKGYLAACVANRARNVNRQAHNRAVGLDNTDVAQTDPNQPQQSLIYNEQMQKLNDAMHKLPDEQREVIMLHLRNGMKFRQIADALDVSVNTAKSRYRYGIEKLRQNLRGQ
jgi:RNA polymerase sigma factor (sigma-70 family)